jgi:hypothetical protein
LDEGLTDKGNDKFHIMPNYPSIKWSRKHFKKKDTFPFLSIVYVGFSLSFETMYSKELFDLIKSMDGKVTLDCYIHKPNNEIINYITSNSFSNINIKESINYFELPEVLSQYDIGVILYKGATDNYIFNAPNKLFEYLACGLDVWFPKEMKGCYPYTSERVHKIDFNDLYRLDFKKLIKNNDTKNITEYFYEKIYPELYCKLIN